MNFLTTLRNFVFVLIIFICAITKAQEKKANIHLRDYHSTRITDVVSSTKYPYFFTADESGKILAYDSKTKRVIKTIRPATGIPVKSLRLANMDEVLTVNQKVPYGDGSLDSIVNIRLYDQKVLQEFQGDFEFIGNQEDVIITQGTNPDKSLIIIDLYDRNYQKVNTYYMTGPVSRAAYDSISKTMAMVEGRRAWTKIALQVGNDYKNTVEIKVPERLEIRDLFFDERKLFAITTDGERNTIELYDLSVPDKFTKPIHLIENYPTNIIEVERYFQNTSLKIVITPEDMGQIQPLILEKKGLNFTEITPKTDGGAVRSVYLPQTNELLFFERYNENFASALRFSVYDNDKQKIKSVVPKDTRPFYSGIFLPDNNWLIVGKEGSSGSFDNQVKFYDSGTFNNRFGNLGYNDYLEVTHRVSDMSYISGHINKDTGLKAFYGYEKKSEYENSYGFFVYDFLNDKVRPLSNIEVDQRTIIDFNGITDNLLLSKEEYNNTGYTDPQEFIILNGTKITPLNGKYKFGKFSKNGKYLLLITEENKVLIKDVQKEKTIFSEDLQDGKYKIFADEENDFLVTNSYFQLSENSCNQASIAYTISDSGKVQANVYDCLNIVDAASKGEVTVLVVKDLGLVIGEEVYQFPFSEFPEKVSLNEDGSNLMVSFTNGKIKVFKTEGLEMVLEMIHPNQEDHVFVNRDNFYFSNTDPEDYIVATSEGKLVPIKSLEKEYFDPAKVLQSLGEPNSEYLNLLNKALSLRQDNLYAGTDIDLQKEKPLKTSPSTKSDLYVLSVGVSNYKESEYNLTFADKDALDMARIYGRLSEEELKNYRTKFFGHRFTLKDENGGDVGSINKYYDYFSLYDLYPLSRDGRYWLEKSDDNFFIWNFKDGTTLPIELPDDVSMDILSSDKMIYPGTENNGFIIESDNNGFYKYGFSSGKFSPLNLPESLKEKITSDNLTFLEGEAWVHFSNEFEEDHYEIILTKGNNRNDKSIQISFNADVYKTRLAEKEIVDTSYVSSAKFEAISANGEHLLYTDVPKQLFYKNLGQPEQLPQKLDLPKLESLDKFSISNDGKTIRIQRTTDDTYQKQILSYSLNGELLQVRDLGEDVKGVLIHDDELLLVRMEEPLVQEEFLNNDELIETHQPASFENVFVHHLVNEEASAASIEQAILNAFKKAKPQDQIVLFIAGHGVLDKTANYYFAPHDMDFKEVSRNGLAFNRIIETLNQSQANNKLLLMDTCHSGNTLDLDAGATVSTETVAGQRGSKARNTQSTPQFKLSDVVSDVFDDFLSKSGVTVVSASSGVDVAYENKSLGNGAFTSAYINLLKEKWLAGGIVLSEDKLKHSVDLTKEDISELLKQVMLLTNGKQVPDLREINTDSTLKMW
ncbi:caspase family protein [Salinimicrobium soli]|uniref:caspase family protein n=2 Tax=Bacteria TaxID=2 RepID=UPI003AAD53B9